MGCQPHFFNRLLSRNFSDFKRKWLVELVEHAFFGAFFVVNQLPCDSFLDQRDVGSVDNVNDSSTLSTKISLKCNRNSQLPSLRCRRRLSGCISCEISPASRSCRHHRPLAGSSSCPSVPSSLFPMCRAGSSHTDRTHLDTHQVLEATFSSDQINQTHQTYSTILASRGTSQSLHHSLSSRRNSLHDSLPSYQFDRNFENELSFQRLRTRVTAIAFFAIYN